ncbi:MAG: tRNA (adenosine(37)-N6)-dimethylallyltransferase MiaA, partial [Kiritimatiellae bacterium]|nr:tRNA (adenosine(37)-N6)-dimethylallyltransferase MiaA [Kiritimatiellia bacterium]
GGRVAPAPKPRARFAVLRIPRETLRRRIAARVDAMFRAGLLEETERLTALYPQWSQTAAGAIGYAEARAVLEGAMKLGEAKQRIAVRTNQLAKRQETWFRHQADPVWIDLEGNEPPDVVAEKVECAWREYGPNRI